MVISGAGVDTTTIDCGHVNQLLLTSANLTLSALTIVDGNNTGFGGGVAVIPAVTSPPLVVVLSGVRMLNCSSSLGGGGLAVKTALNAPFPVSVILHNFIAQSNSAVAGKGGGVLLYSPGNLRVSAGTWTVSVVSSSFAGNIAASGVIAYFML